MGEERNGEEDRAARKLSRQKRRDKIETMPLSEASKLHSSAETISDNWAE